MVPRERFAPIGKHANQLPLCEMCLYEIFGHISQPEPFERGIQAHRDVVEHQLAFDAHLQFLFLFLEFPREEAAVGRQAGGNAVLLRQIARGFRVRMSGEVVGRATRTL